MKKNIMSSGSKVAKRESNIEFFRIILILFVFCACKFLTYNLSLILRFKSFEIHRFLGSLLPNSYFALIYASLLLVSPFVNFLLCKLTYKDFRKLIFISACLFSIYPSFSDFLCSRFNIGYMEMSNVSINGNDWGYSFVNFLFMYILGAFLRFSKENGSIIFNHKKIFDILISFLSSILIFIFSFINPHSTNYCNPFVIFQAIGLFMFFLKFNFQNDFINWSASSVWGIYSIHMGILWFWQFFKIKEYVQKPLYILFINVFVTVLGVFIFSLVLHKIYEFLFIPVYKLANKIGCLNYVLKVDSDD